MREWEDRPKEYCEVVKIVDRFDDIFHSKNTEFYLDIFQNKGKFRKNRYFRRFLFW